MKEIKVKYNSKYNPEWLYKGATWSATYAYQERKFLENTNEGIKNDYSFNYFDTLRKLISSFFLVLAGLILAYILWTINLSALGINNFFVKFFRFFAALSWSYQLIIFIIYYLKSLTCFTRLQMKNYPLSLKKVRLAEIYTIYFSIVSILIFILIIFFSGNIQTFK